MSIDDDWMMGALAAQDAYRPLGNDPWTNTMKGSSDLPLDPVVKDDPNSPVVFKTASPYANITEQDLSRGMDVVMATSGGGLATNPIKAFHSSPHTFDKFDISRIGTGEGAQVYGHGLYFAENPAVSGQGGQYWNDFRHRFGGNEGKVAELLQQQGFDRGKALKIINDEIEQARALPTDRMFNDVAKQSHIDQLLARQRLLESDKPVGPRTYEVDIKADPAHMLDWDAKIGEQPKAVQDLFRKQIDQFGPEARMNAQLAIASSRGRKLPQVSEELAEAGVPGIRYLDEGSRHHPLTLPNNPISNEARSFIDAAKGDSAKALGLFRESNPINRWSQPERDEIRKVIESAANKPTSNYVIFDPKIIDIRKMYGIGGLGAGLGAAYGMGDLASQGKYEQQL